MMCKAQVKMPPKLDPQGWFKPPSIGLVKLNEENDPGALS